MLVQCTTCSQEFEKCLLKINRSKSGHHFCSQSCSMTFNNRIPKRKLSNRCKLCNSLIRTSRSYCKECFSLYTLNTRLDLDSLTKKEVLILSHAHQKLRVDSRRKKLEADPQAFCVVCGYSLFVDVAHIKAIASFPDEAMVQEMNDISNLVYLCPNHHREFDCGVISL